MFTYQFLIFIVILQLFALVYLYIKKQKAELTHQKLEDKLNELNTNISKKNQELENLNEYLKSFAFYDELTNLLNRRKFFEMATTEFNQSKRYKKNLSLVMLDIDYFKQINDNYGHDKGDFVLQEFSKLLKDAVRDCDFVARYGGEEFIIMLPSTDIENTKILVTRLMKKIRLHEYEIDKENKIHVLCSFGLVELSNEHIDIKNFIKSADIALYKAKHSGRDCFKIYRKGM